jgi:hypothetical protein
MAAVKKKARHAPDRMISGKKRKRPAKPGVAVRTATLDGATYQWWPRHGWQFIDPRTRAISISVSLDPARRRELILDLTMTLTPEDDRPSETALAAAVERGIHTAMDAGWDPESRGRAFRLEVES